MEEPRSGRFTTAEADLPALLYGHLVGDSTGPASRAGSRLVVIAPFGGKWKQTNDGQAKRLVLMGRVRRLHTEKNGTSQRLIYAGVARCDSDAEGADQARNGKSASASPNFISERPVGAERP